MSDAFLAFLGECQGRIAPVLEAVSSHRPSEFAALDTGTLSGRLHEAMTYSLLNGGKRVRSALVYAAAGAAGGAPSDRAEDAIAASLECLHAYSLVHDDLPAMDDDDLRRGQPSCHRAYDEATAILTGDALQAIAFELLADCPDLAPAQRIDLIKALAAASGPRGMVGGQFIDLNIARLAPGIDLLQTIHRLKTGALIRAAVAMGGIAAAADPATLDALDRYGCAIGLAFQVKDDLLDIEGTTETLGKQQGSDLANDRMTYPALLGPEASRTHLQELLQEAIDALAPLGASAGRLVGLARYIVERDH
jgi:geranylgeranyl pyrophosphate synthase